MIRRIVREPNLILGVVTAFIGLLVVFGVHINHEQDAAILLFLGALIALIRFITTPSAEVVVQQEPGKVARAAAAATLPNGTPVAVVAAPTAESHAEDPHEPLVPPGTDGTAPPP